MKKIVDEVIYSLLLAKKHKEAFLRFSCCLSDVPDSNKKEILEVANSVAEEFKEAFTEIGISKFIDVEKDPDNPDDFLMWTVE